MAVSNRSNGSVVAEFEREFAQYVGAEYGIACCNGTATLHTALEACHLGPLEGVGVPALTMASTTLAVLHAGGIPHFMDIHPGTWVVHPDADWQGSLPMPVSLYGLWSGFAGEVIDDAAETLNPHQNFQFTSYSFQASKILSTGEGGMLVTNDPDLAAKARQFRDLGYPPDARQHMKSPQAIRHTMLGWNYRMADLVAAEGLKQLEHADALLAARRYSAQCYREAIQDFPWIQPQHVPEGWPHSYWTYAIALPEPEMWPILANAIVTLRGEAPYAAWRLTYQEPAFRHLAPDGTCPVAEALQPRLMQLQTNHDCAGAEQAATVLRKALQDLAVMAS